MPRTIFYPIPQDVIPTKVVAVTLGGTGASSAAQAVINLGAATADHTHPVQTTVSGNAGSATKLETIRKINGVEFDGTADVTIHAVDSTARIAQTEKGAANGVASLDANGLVPANQLPSFVDDVLEFTNPAAFPATGEAAKIYVSQTDGKIYRWSGSVYIEISATAGTADAATKLASSRQISLSGDVSGSVLFDGTENVTINAQVSDDSHNHSFDNLTGKPTTRSGYGITDAASDTHGHAFADLTDKPTTRAGYGITDAADAAHQHAFADLTGKPTTRLGYGITDAAALNHTHDSVALADVAVKLQTARLINGVTFDGTGDITISATDQAVPRLAAIEKGVPYGVATLDSAGVVPANQLPSYVDDVVEFADLATFPASGSQGKIYVALDTDRVYRWSGSTYIEVSRTAGTADAAVKLETARRITLLGDLEGFADFDGTADIEITATVADDSHNHGIQTVTGLVDALTAKQDTLQSGTNIKTLNGASLLGDGDLPMVSFERGDIRLTAKTLAEPDWIECKGFTARLISANPGLAAMLGAIEWGENAIAQMNLITTAPSNQVLGCQFSANSTFLAVTHNASPYLTVFKKNVSGYYDPLTVASKPTGVSQSVEFSDDEQLMAVASSVAPYVFVYSWNGTTFVKLANPTTPLANAAYDVSIANNQYLAVTSTAAPYLYVYDLAGNVFTPLATPPSVPVGVANGVSFQGNQLAVTSEVSPYLTTWTQSGTTFTKNTLATTAQPTSAAQECAWNAAGTRLAVVTTGYPYAMVYSANAGVLTPLAPLDVPPVGSGSSVAFANYTVNGLPVEVMAVAHNEFPFVSLYKLDGTSIQKFEDMSMFTPATAIDVSFGNSGKYLAVTHYQSPYLTIYKSTFYDRDTQFVTPNLQKANLVNNLKSYIKA